MYANKKHTYLIFTAMLMGTACFFVFGTTVEAATTNPYYAIDPFSVGSSPSALLPKGTVYQDTVPDTLDLADRAKWFIQGAAQEQIPYQGIWMPGGPGL